MVHLLQVWYSSAWSVSTLQAFRSAVLAVLDDHSTQSSSGGSGGSGGTGGSAAALDPEVQLLLQHWQAADVTLAASRAQWFESQERTHVWIGSFKRKVIGLDGLVWCQDSGSLHNLQNSNFDQSYGHHGSHVF